MSALFTPVRYKLSVAEFHKLGDAGILSEDARVELIDGELIEMAPIGPRHASAVDTLVELLAPQAPGRFRLSTQNPLSLPPRSEPQPDLMLLRLREDRYASSLPVAADVLLLIEVADRSADYDRGPKLALYAQAGIREYWLVDLAAVRLEAYRAPGREGYGQRLELGVSDTVSPEALPAVALELRTVLG
jgi:Uma2 family endonuclease